MTVKKYLILLILPAALGCSTQEPDSLGLQESEISIKKGETYQITVNSKSKVNFATDNDFHADVDDNGKVSTNYAGKSTIKVSNAELSREIPVIVEPNFTLFKDPVLDFTLTKEEIIKLVGEPVENAPNIIRYAADLNGTSMFYQFMNNGSFISAVIIKNEFLNDLDRHISERYKYENYSNLIHYYRNSLKIDDVSVCVAVSPVDANTTIVVYSKYPEDRKQKIREEELKGNN